MTVGQLSTLLSTNDNIRLLDVRTPGEFESAHIAGAYNVPLDQLHEHAGEMRHARSTVVLICQSGRRAQQAGQVLRTSGMANVHVLDGGIAEWMSLGMAVRRI